MTPPPSSPPKPPAPAPSSFGVATVQADLGRRAVRSGFARFVEQGSVLVLSVVSAMVLARLLRPEDFGLMAMVAVPLAFVTNLKHFGLPMALVHRDEVQRETADALYWITVGLSAGACAAVAATGPLLARLFGKPVLTELTAASAGALFILALGAPQQALLMRQMRFGILSAITIGATAGGMTVGVVAAWQGLGAWSFVLQTLATNGLLVGAWWMGARWWPALRLRPWRRLDLRAFMRYGLPYASFGALDYASRNADRVLVGMTAGASVLGLYANAYRWSLFPLWQVFQPLLGVAVSGLSRARHDPARFRAYTRRSVLPVLAITLPVLAFVVPAAEAVVRVLLGTQWLGAIPLLQWLAAAAFVRCFSMVARWLFLAEGRTRLQLRWGLVSAPVMVLGVAVGVQWGAYGVAVGFFAASLALLVPEAAVAVHGSRVRMADLVAAAWRPAVGAVVAAVVVSVSSGWFPEAALPALVGQAALFGGVYTTFWLALPGGWVAAREVFRLWRMLLPDTHATSEDS